MKLDRYSESIETESSIRHPIIRFWSDGDSGTTFLSICFFNSYHSPSPTSCPTRSRNHCTLSLTIYRFTVPRANRRFETRVFEQKGADENRLDNERSGTVEKWTERKMDEKSRRTLSCYARNCSVHETMTFSTVFLSSAAISARS